jgi:hypothetical protein
MVEREDQVQKGLQSGAFKEDGYILVNKLMNRMCAPKPGEDEKVQAIILWTKESANDKVKTWDKVVCPNSIQYYQNPSFYINIVWRSCIWSRQTGQ